MRVSSSPYAGRVCLNTAGHTSGHPKASLVIKDFISKAKATDKKFSRPRPRQTFFQGQGHIIILFYVFVLFFISSVAGNVRPPSLTVTVASHCPQLHTARKPGQCVCPCGARTRTPKHWWGKAVIICVVLTLHIFRITVYFSKTLVGNAMWRMFCVLLI